jgi:CBS domain-containing protein
MNSEVGRCRVYSNGGQLEATRSWEVTPCVIPRAPTLADRIPVSQIMTRDVVCARSDLGVSALVKLMMDHRIGCVPIVDERGRPRGIVTKLDLVESGRSGVTAAEVMMPLAITLNMHATVAHAAAVMSLEDFHHVMVIDKDGTLRGVVSTMDICRWLARNDGFLSR